ncbi:GNAT family N-acetyltransferase [Arthrobacter sp. Sa2CUA1]|uniref:GNAT family N-acetyltransferase n=1 Tax=Arthrobacter gallicola TaxID=2762225 RepID=A0ABR8UW56_9MICC|nr:GNAT family N-acetyltransferase [Arthrobacter gallicola]MBD7996753.1 GNAT family N-acetyltransferase [Arthrobacter gallicola]
MPSTDQVAFAVGPARDIDTAALASLAALTFPLACPPAVTEEEAAEFAGRTLSEDAFAGFVADPARRVLVARSDPGLVGYALLVLEPPADPLIGAALEDLPQPTAEVSKFYTHPAAHGRGVASGLMTAALDTAAEAGARTVWLGVNGMNLRAQAFYRKSGFCVVGRKQFPLGRHLFDDLVFARSLTLEG